MKKFLIAGWISSPEEARQISDISKCSVVAQHIHYIVEQQKRLEKYLVLEKAMNKQIKEFNKKKVKQ